MEGRGAVRSSARLGAVGIVEPQSQQTVADDDAAKAAAAVAAAQRRARAAERAREVEDSPRVLRDKCRRLARALRNAKHLVVYTGAGISTAADIPDYRGPNGVWTRLQRGETLGRVEVSRATPTFTHMALTALWARGALKFVVSQNCDGLHLRSGLPRKALAELHGDMFAEHCAACRRVYLRAFDTTERTARHAHGTKRLCHTCGLELRDTIVHFGERGRTAWPLNWAGALRHAAAADVILCLGSSLKVLRRYPRLWCMHRAPQARPALFVVNLQWTPKDAVAALKINARCDAVMAEVARRLRLRVPKYKRARDPLLAHATPLAPQEAHTTRRSELSPAREVDSFSPPSSSTLSSPSASDSDEEVPLRQLAARLKGSRPPPGLYRAFQVTMKTGDATILLRPEHAPVEPELPPEPPPAKILTPLRPANITSPTFQPANITSPPQRPLSDLRKFRMIKRPSDQPPILTNGFIQNTVKDEASPPDIKVKKEEDKDDILPWRDKQKVEVKTESETIEPKEEDTESVTSSSSGEEATRTLAAAIIRRALLLCRASLYPGLHSIIIPGVRGECAWCGRHYSSKRCLWYPPSFRAPAGRVWRRVRGRKYLCACCGDETPTSNPSPDEGGWYGKGYRKGRRRKR